MVDGQPHSTSSENPALSPTSSCLTRPAPIPSWIFPPAPCLAKSVSPHLSKPYRFHTNNAAQPMSWLGLTAPFTNSFRWTPIQHALTLTQTRQLPYNPVCMFWITPRWNTPPTMMSQLMYLFTCLSIRLHPDIMHAHDHTIPVSILSLTIHLQPLICSLSHQATETTLHLAMVSHTAHHMVTAACLQVSSTGTCTFSLKTP